MRLNYKNFKAMVPSLYEEDSLARVEHFDDIENIARPFRTISASTSTQGAITSCAITKHVKLNDVIYGLGLDVATPANPYIHKWVSTEWQGLGGFGAAGTASPVIFTFLGDLYGLWKGTHVWKMTTFPVFTGAHIALTYTTFCDPIIHSKDGLAYIFVDNKVYRSDVGGAAFTTLTLVLTLPTNFVITSAKEKGDYIAISGYDSTTSKSTVYVWDRDSSLATLTAKYEIGNEVILHNAVLGGNLFVISLRIDTGNTIFQEKPTLVIRYLNGDNLEIKSEFIFDGFGIASNKIGGQFELNNRLYFSGYVKMVNESSSKWVVFRLNQRGELSIALNVGVDTGSGTPLLTGIFRDGEGWWLSGGADGSWNSVNSYSTVSAIETTKVRSEELNKSVELVGSIVSHEPLPTAGSISLYSRANESTAWSLLGTFATDNAVKSSLVKSGCANIPELAKERQFRLESTGGAVITEWQIDLDELNNESYG